MLTQMEIEAIARQIITSKTFEYSSFNDGKAIIYGKENVELCTYDCLSLCFYKHSFCSEEYRKLLHCMEQLDCFENQEEEKKRTEYKTLFQYALLNPPMLAAKISKEVQPDFVLNIGKEKVGIEVTELTTSVDKILQKIAQQNFGKSFGAKKIAQNAQAKHGKKAKAYRYWTLDAGTIAVGTSDIDCLVRKKKYADEVLTKYEKYKEKMGKYDNFKILCNAGHCTFLNDETDIEEIWTTIQTRLSLKPGGPRFEVIILALNADETVKSYSRFFN